MKKTVNENDLQVCINAHRQHKTSDSHILQVFSQLARSLLIRFPFDFPNPDGVLAEAADLCLVKMEKYDSAKSKALNFFTTIILCYFQQRKRSHINLRKLSKNSTETTPL